MPIPESKPIGKVGPAKFASAVTPSDATNLAQVASALYVGVAGNVAVVLTDGSVVTFVGAQAGSVLPINCMRVNSTNTTASSIVALYE